MLAKEIKIMTIKRQREQIEHMLKGTALKSRDGDAAVRYVGHIYPENIEHFKNEKFDVTKVECDALTAQTQGLPVYLFTVSDDVVLTEEEMQQAEAVETEDDVEGFLGFLAAIADAAGQDGEESDEEEDSDEENPGGDNPD